MKRTKFFAPAVAAMIVLSALTACNESGREPQKSETLSPETNNGNSENEVWQMEEQYWEYVKNNDTLTYKTLWHDDFIGYPSFGDGVSGKSGIARWIPALHQDTSLTFSYALHKKGVNAIDGVVIAFYDVDLMMNKDSMVVMKQTDKITHTWKKYDDNWLILGGMSGTKSKSAP